MRGEQETFSSVPKRCTGKKRAMNCLLSTSQGKKTPVKNIVLLITDTFRYDNLGQRAQRVVRTPELDRFCAERATEIEKFFIGSFPTIPQRTDLATGVLGWPHYGWQPLDLSSPNHIAGLLRQAGYSTQLLCDTPHLFNARFQHA